MDMKRKRASSDDDDDEDLEDFITITKTIEELEILDETYVSKQHNAYRKLDKTVHNLRLQGGKEKKKNVELEKMLNIYSDENFALKIRIEELEKDKEEKETDENFALKIRIDELEKYKEEKETEFKDLESLNQNILVREREYNYKIQEARKELIKCMKGLQGGVTIGLKRLGELDPAPFVASVKKQKCSGSGPPKADSETDSSVEAGRLCSLWENLLRDPSWHPYRMVSVGDKYQEIIDDEDPKLKGLKAELGEGVYKAVTTSLLEMNEYNPSGRYPVLEIWNFVEGRKASLKEGYGFLFQKLKNVGKSSVVSSPSIAIAVANPSSSAPRPNIATTNPSSSAPCPNIVAANPSFSTPCPNIATTNPSSSTPGPNIAAANPSSSTPSYLDPCEIPAEEFHDFMADKSYGKFRSGQIWALYCYLDGLPRYYVQITQVKTNPDFEVHTQYLDSSFSPKRQIRWADKNMPICCGTFKFGEETEVYKNVQPFSHMVSAKLVSKNVCEIYPRRGEVWAIYKDFRTKWTCSYLKSCKYDIVEVIGDNVSKIKVLLLEQVTGFNKVFKPKKNLAGVDVIREITEAKLLVTFSHQIPAFRLTDENEGSLKGYWELYRNSMPDHLFASN